MLTRFFVRLPGAAAKFSDSGYVKSSIKAICWFTIGDPGYRPGENSVVAAV